MIVPTLPIDEAHRQRSLESIHLLETAIEERFERVTRLASRLMEVPIAAITLIDGGRQWFKSIQGLNVSETPRDVSFCGHTILGDEPLVVEDATKDERFSDNPLVTGDPNIRFYAGYPIHAPDGKKIGALCIIDRKPRVLSPLQLEDLKDLAAMVDVEIHSKQLAVAQMKMNEELATARKAALIDPLTRLWNRAGSEEFLARQHRVAAEKGEKFCIAMIDIDYFKRINDTHGHAAGDEVLREVARRILRGTRTGDFVCRMGGEEFLVMIADPHPADAAIIAGRIMEAVRSLPIDVGGVTIPVTISMGLAHFDPAGLATCKDVIRFADAALYEAKGAGRNRIEWHLRNGA